jgi:hypothetical protein
MELDLAESLHMDSEYYLLSRVSHIGYKNIRKPVLPCIIQMRVLYISIF